MQAGASDKCGCRFPSRVTIRRSSRPRRSNCDGGLLHRNRSGHDAHGARLRENVGRRRRARACSRCRSSSRKARSSHARSCRLFSIFPTKARARSRFPGTRSARSPSASSPVNVRRKRRHVSCRAPRAGSVTPALIDAVRSSRRARPRTSRKFRRWKRRFVTWITSPRPGRRRAPPAARTSPSSPSCSRCRHRSTRVRASSRSKPRMPRGWRTSRSSKSPKPRSTPGSSRSATSGGACSPSVTSCSSSTWAAARRISPPSQSSRRTAR